MKLIPLVFIFACIFMLASGALRKDVRATSKVVEAISGAWQAERSLEKAFVEQEYKSLPTKSGSKSSDSKDKKAVTHTYRSLRIARFYTPIQKLSLQPWIKGEMGGQETRKIFERLLDVLYDPTPLARQITAATKEKLLNAMLNASRETPEASLEQLDLHDPHLQQLLYALCRGSLEYKTGQGGIPMLTDFVTLNRAGAAIHVKKACRPVLIAFVGQEAAQTIAEIEEEAWERSNYRHVPISREGIWRVLLAQNTTPLYERAIFEALTTEARLIESAVPVRVWHSKLDFVRESLPFEISLPAGSES